MSPFVFASPKGRDVALCKYILEPRVVDKLLFTCLDKLSTTEIIGLIYTFTNILFNLISVIPGMLINFVGVKLLITVFTG